MKMKKSLVMCLFAAASGLTDCFAVDAAIRPGGVDGSPFWNRYARMFTYPPAFDFRPVEGAVRYRFLVHDKVHHCLTQEADLPTAALTPVWDRIPPGFVAVWCQGVLSNGQAVVTRGNWGTDYRLFWKQAPFKPGSYPRPPRPYGEAAEKFLTWIFDGNATAFRHFRETGDPHGDWPVGIPISHYPAKIHSALIRAGVDFAVRCPARRDEAMALARVAAEYMQKVSCGKDGPCAGFPPTYEGDSRVCTAYAGQIMMIYPADAGKAYLTLAKATGERRWADAAKLIGETYLKLQGRDGTWPLKVWAKTGRASIPNRLQPLAVVDFLERLFAETGDGRYRAAADRAFAWVERGPMRDWNWEAQYEDAPPSPVPYYNMAGIVACQAVEHVLRRYPGDEARLGFCREAMRFVEDQFICWELPCDENGFGACTLDKLPTDQPYDYRSWTVPCVLEQSTYAVPVSAAAGVVIGAYLSLHKATGDPADLARARAIGDALVCAQRDNGAIPDVIATPYYQCWLNDAYTAVEGLRKLAAQD